MKILIFAVLAFVICGFGPSAQASEPISAVNVSKIAAGDSLMVKGGGKKGANYVLSIQKVLTFTGSDGGITYQFEGKENGGKGAVVIDVLADGNLEAATVEEDLGLEDIGVKPGKLDKIDENEKGAIKYDGDKYIYEDSGENIFKDVGKGSEEKIYYWEFEIEGDVEYISVIEYDTKKGDQYEVDMAESVPADTVMVTFAP